MESPEVAHIEDISDDGHSGASKTTLLDLLSNPLILYHTVPFLPLFSLVALGATSKAAQELVYKTPNVFRHLDLSHLTRLKAAELGSIDHGGEIWRNQQIDENITENDFYGGPLRGVFNNLRKRGILKDVHTLILDGLTVPSDLVAEIILDPSFNVRILSIREVQHLNEAKLMQALQYAVRPSRPENTPKLQGLYIFGPKDPSPVSHFRRHINTFPPESTPNSTPASANGILSTQRPQLGSQLNQRSGQILWEEIDEVNKWYQRTGRVITRVSDAWSGTIHACQGVISFDAVLCSGPRHSPPVLNSEQEVNSYLPPTIATFSLNGCSGCGTAPEGFSHFGSSPLDSFPLLSPPPLHSSSAKLAKTPSSSVSKSERRLLARCTDCLRQRHCQSCHKWWCESCYQVGGGFASSITEAFDSAEENVKVHMGLCIEHCLVPEMTSGSNGMSG
ncbi:hypothetical protein BP6252_10162 [Coleophoma cylindrospora]|uniref:Uncharacterized protein n=1 Tax=Coleophoma cylindrospora TaxID=1849047 RepID=A0A3D8QXL7_9HELO|nr:hypothetical protein BP6252_10162 [Coleophoma cylindrospora]